MNPAWLVPHFSHFLFYLFFYFIIIFFMQDPEGACPACASEVTWRVPRLHGLPVEEGWGMRENWSVLLLSAAPKFSAG